LLVTGRPSKLRYFEQWEKELNRSMKPSSWHTAMAGVKRATHCLDHIEAAYKLWMRWYLAPQCLAHIYPGAQPTFWRCCRDTGTLTPIFWHCPALTNYWQQIQNLVEIST
ncbi:Hypothetical predicted protein, partial [Pelobates cultripes]